MSDKKINIVTQFNGFNNFISFKHPLSNNAIALYMRLLDIWNKSNWEEWIPLSQSKLMDLSNAQSRNTAYNTRNELKEHGLIDFTKAKKGQLPVYHIFELTASGEIVPERKKKPKKEIHKGSESSLNFKHDNEDISPELSLNFQQDEESCLNFKPNTQQIKNISPELSLNFKHNNEPIFDEDLNSSLENYNTNTNNKTKLNETKLNLFNNNNLLAKAYSSPKNDSPLSCELEIINTQDDGSETQTVLPKTNTQDKPNDNIGLDKQGVLDFYNDNRRDMPKIVKMTDTRYRAFKARVKEYSLDTVKQTIVRAAQSEFLNGNNDRNWTADFDWIMKPSNFIKILEGRYDNKPQYNRPKKRDVFDNPLWREAFGDEMPLEGTLF